MRQIIRAITAALAVTMLCAASASAATTIGQTFVPVIGDLPDQLNVQTATAADQPSYAVPAGGGVITSFSHMAETTPGGTIKLVVLRPTGPDYGTVGSSAEQTLTGDVLNTFQTRIPVQAGDVIGFWSSSWELAAATQVSDSANIFRAQTADPAPGSTVADADFYPYDGYILDISANVEADADLDGFGDETQDKCATDATTQGVCPDKTAPVLSINAGKAVSTSSGITFSVLSSEAASVVATGTMITFKKKSANASKSLKLKTVTKSVAAATTTKVTLKFSSKVKKTLAKAKKLKAVLVVSATDAAGNVTSRTTTLTVKAKKKK